MSGANDDRPSLRLIEGGRSARRGPTASEEEKSAYLASLLAHGAASTGADEAEWEEFARTELANAAQAPTTANADPFDPLTRHTERVEGDRGGPTVPAAGVFENVLGAIPKVEPGALPSSDSAIRSGVIVAADSRPIGDAAKSSQAGYRRGGAKRARRDRRRRQRREYDKQRLEKVREEIFAPYGQTPDVPDLPALNPAVHGQNLKTMRDGTGRKARELCAKLPLTQQMAIYWLGYAALPWVRRGRATAFTRSDLAAAPKLPKGRDELVAALQLVCVEVTPTLWWRRIVCAAWGMWAHRGKPLGEAARKAARGGVFAIEGFCQNALSWLVPRSDGTPYSRTVLWGPTGPFALLGAAHRQLGRKVAGESGVALWKRWQPPAGVARFKGPTKKNPKTGKTERFAVAMLRYDPPMAGRTASSLARRARGALRELARTVVSVMTPWVELPKPRKRKKPPRPQEAEEEPLGADRPSVVGDARAPP